jgi:hypothetical protein
MERKRAEASMIVFVSGILSIMIRAAESARCHKDAMQAIAQYTKCNKKDIRREKVEVIWYRMSDIESMKGEIIHVTCKR